VKFKEAPSQGPEATKRKLVLDSVFATCIHSRKENMAAILFWIRNKRLFYEIVPNKFSTLNPKP
jgi:hypothetical protein